MFCDFLLPHAHPCHGARSVLGERVVSPRSLPSDPHYVIIVASSTPKPARFSTIYANRL